MNTAPKCPICKKPVVAEYRPFCSKRCADVDLGRWLTNSYVVDGEDGDALDAIPGAGDVAPDDPDA